MGMAVWTLVFLGAVGFFLWQLRGRFQVLLGARRDDRRDYSGESTGTRIKNLVVYGLLQKKFFTGEQPAGWMHIVVFWTFLILGLQVVTMFLRGWFPEFTFPGMHTFAIGATYGLLKDVFQLLVLVGISYALFRWLVLKPERLMGFLPAEERLRGQSHTEAVVILLFIATIMISGYFYDGAGAALYASLNGQLPVEVALAPITRLIANSFSTATAAEMFMDIAWWTHNGVILVFLNLLPRSKHFHIITALPNVFLTKVEPKGRLAKKEFESEDALFGRSQINHFNWKQVLDMYTCTECGRCSSVCPATATGKPLAPRQFLLNLRDNLYANQKKLVAGESEFDVIVGEDKAVIDEVIWSCNACRACEEACPVNIEYVDKIVDIRQHLVQEQARFPEELNQAFKGLENNSNPWGIGADERDAWAQGMDIPRAADNPDVEYLYYVGCGGAFDANNRKTVQDFARILKQAGVSFAILGKEELCNGETARRLGNEYLFQMMAAALVEKVNALGVKKILVNCPHCFNTMANEYPEFGGEWEVIRAGTMVQRLLDEGKIKLKPETTEKEKVAYHDSCYYARFNDVVDEPRNILNKLPGTEVAEMELNGKQGMCCGAGGGRMWMEEEADQRVNHQRTDQALNTNPDVIAVSCPFCRIMIGNGVTDKGKEDKVQVKDVVQIVAERMETTPA